MLSKLLKVRSFLLVSVSNENKKEFVAGINRINVTRAKITSIAFIILEAMIITMSFIIKGEDILNSPGIYYLTLYLLMFFAMVLFLTVSIKLEKNITKNSMNISVFGIAFISFILLWSVFVSLLDQLSSGQIIVYTVSIMAIAITPIYKPLTLLILYLIVQSVFFILMPFFQKSDELLFSNYINSTTFLMISWAISCMRYKKHVDDFNNEKLIQEKSIELEQVNIKLEETNRKLEILSQTDSLTGVFNRLLFDKKVKEEWDRCKINFTPLSLIMIDIDFFKEFNDNYGHQMGDYCIRQVAGVLSACVKRPSDIVARYGGDEFAVLLTNVDEESVSQFGEQLKKKVEKLDFPHLYSAVSKNITISLGAYTTIPSDASSIKEFIRTADKALYKAKKERNNIVIA